MERSRKKIKNELNLIEVNFVNVLLQIFSRIYKISEHTFEHVGIKTLKVKYLHVRKMEIISGLDQKSVELIEDGEFLRIHMLCPSM